MYWPMIENKFAYYMFAPPWVKLYVNDVINQTKIAAKGSGLDPEKDRDATTLTGLPKKPTLFSREIQIT